MKRLITLALLGLFTIIFSMGFNIALHELGHYVVADEFGYEPKIHFNSPIDNETNTVEIDAAVAYVSYKSYTADTTRGDAFIAFAGPLVNLILGILFTVLYIYYPRKDQILALILLIFAITSYVAGFSNLYPHGSSDGTIIFEYLRNT